MKNKTIFQRFKLDKEAHSDSCEYCVSDARLNFISSPCDQSGVLKRYLSNYMQDPIPA